jgi:photosystem II stability/assembly factor-like uncharacterized protein
VTWQISRIATTDDLNAVAYATPDIVAAVGKTGSIFRSGNGGATWDGIPSPVDDALVAIDFADADRGIAVGANGIAIRTMDGGEQWEVVEGFGTGAINDVEFDGSGTGMLVGAGGLIGVSTDFGASWNVSVDASAGDLRFVAVAGDTWFIVGDPWIFLRSEDQGTSWTPHVISTDAANNPFSDISLFGVHDEDSLSIGVIDKYLFTYDLYRSTNGGESWSKRSYQSYVLNGTAISIRDGVGVVVGRQADYRTSDRGRTWNERKTGIGTSYSVVKFADSSRGIATASENLYLFDSGRWVGGPFVAIDATTDGGETWESRRVFEGENVALRSAAYPDPTLAIAVGDSGLAVRSIDGGHSWERLDLGTTARLDNVSFADRLHGVITGIGVLLRTDDGGSSWRALATPAATAIWELATPAADRIVLYSGLTSSICYIHVSVDGGESWTEHPFHPGGQSLFFIDSLRGWSAGGLGGPSSQGSQLNDVIHTSSDGGETWTKQLDEGIGIQSGLLDIAFADATNGIAVGGNEKILRTTDGGLTWEVDPFALTGADTYRSVAYPTPYRAFIITARGNILRSTEQGVISDVGEGRRPSGALDLTLLSNPTRTRNTIRFLTPQFLGGGTPPR